MWLMSFAIQASVEVFDSWKAALLVFLSELPTCLASKRSAFEFAFFDSECLNESPQKAVAQAYLAYLTDALRFESVVSTALAMFFTVALLQLGNIPDPFIGKSTQSVRLQLQYLLCYRSQQF